MIVLLIFVFELGEDFEKDGQEVYEEVFVVFVLLVIVCMYDEFVGVVVFFMLILFCKGSLVFCVNVVMIFVVIVINIDVYFNGVVKMF